MEAQVLILQGMEVKLRFKLRASWLWNHHTQPAEQLTFRVLMNLVAWSLFCKGELILLMLVLCSR